jgi:hypothetical protein
MPAKKPPAKKAAAKKAPERKPTPIRPGRAKGKSADGVTQFSLQSEMLQLIQRVSANKSKRTLTALVDDGPLRSFLIALDEDATLDGDALDGNVAVQCLFGEAQINIGRAKKVLHVGDLAVLEPGIGVRDVESVEPCVLLVTVAAGGAE